MASALDQYVPGQRVRAYWTNCNFEWEADGVISRVNAKTVRVDIDGATALVTGVDWVDGKLTAYSKSPRPRANWNSVIPVPGTKGNRVVAYEAAPEDAIENAKNEERSRLQRKADRFDGFASNAYRSANDAYQRSNAATEGIPFGQPILVGHHSERGHRKALQRSWDLMGKSVSESKRAAGWERRAGGVEAEMRRKGLA